MQLWQQWMVRFGFVVVAVQAASIPVQVLYENEYRGAASVRNLDAKVQLSPDELIEASRNLGAVKNLDAKVQLSQEELNVASKHLPENSVVQSDQTEEDEFLLQKIQDIITSGVQNIRKNVESSDEGKSVKPETWKKLDVDVASFLERVKSNRNALRQTQPDFFQNLGQQFSNFTSGFVSQFTNPNQNNASQSDEGQEGGFGQNIVSIFTNGFQQIQSGFTSLTGQQNSPANSTVLGDPASSPPPQTNPFQGFISQAQGVFGNFNPFTPPTTGAPGTHGDPVSTTGPFDSISNAFSQFGQQIGQLNPFTQPPPAQQGDETTSPAGPVQFVQGIQQVFNQFNPFNNQQQATKAPPTTAPPAADPTKSPLQVAAENVGSQIGAGNPFQGIGEQVAGAISSNNPFQGGGAPLQPIIPGNPLQGGGSNPIQEIAGQYIPGNPLQGGGSNPIQEIAGQYIPSNPLQGGGNNPIQEIAGQYIPSNPLQSGSNPLGQLVPNNPLQGGGNPLEQLVPGNPLQGGNPLQQVGGQLIPGNPLQGGSTLQNLVGQVTPGQRENEITKKEDEVKPVLES